MQLLIDFLPIVLFFAAYFITDDFYTALLVIMVAAVDVGAYFAGRAFGSRPLAPSLSPKKTWEGVWGGLHLVETTLCLVE